MNMDEMLNGGKPDILTLDDFTSEFQKETQYAEFYKPQSETAAPGDIDPDLIDPEHETNADERPDFVGWQPEGGEEKQISPERYAKTGCNIARLFDTGFDFVASDVIAKGSKKSYHASEKDLDDLGDAWAEIAEEKQWDLGPVPRLILLIVMVYGPLTKEAFNDRRMLELERRADEHEEKQRALEAEIKNLQNELNRVKNGNGTDAAAEAK